MVVPTQVNWLALHAIEFLDYFRFIALELISNGFEYIFEFFILILLRECPCPVHRQVKVTATCIQFTGLA